MHIVCFCGIWMTVPVVYCTEDVSGFHRLQNLIGDLSLELTIGVWIDAGVQVTTARKAVTLLLSYMIFTKPITEQHATGLLLIAMGIILKMLPVNKQQPRKSAVAPTIEVDRSLVENADGVEEEKRPLV